MFNLTLRVQFIMVSEPRDDELYFSVDVPISEFNGLIQIIRAYMIEYNVDESYTLKSIEF